MPSMSDTLVDSKAMLLGRVKMLKTHVSASHQVFLDILQQIREVSSDSHPGSKLQCNIFELTNEWEGHCGVSTVHHAISSN